MKCVISASATGGHLYPALRVADVLRQSEHEVLFVGGFSTGADKIRTHQFNVVDISLKGFNFRQPLSIPNAFIAMVKGIGQAFQYLQKEKPNIVIGFGGYGAFPVVLSAFVLRIPTLIHEQNVIPGKANRVLALFVNKIALSFKGAQKYLPRFKSVLTGCPCQMPPDHLDREEILKSFGLKKSKKTILIFGGSQGSRRINDVWMSITPELKAHVDFQVIHVSGQTDYARLQLHYEQLGVPYALFPFLDKMPQAYAISDLVIARAGAATVSELMIFMLPAILIPYPFAGGHQVANAHVLQEAGVADVIEEKELTEKLLIESIKKNLSMSIEHELILKKLEGIRWPDAAQRIASMALHVASS